MIHLKYKCKVMQLCPKVVKHPVFETTKRLCNSLPGKAETEHRSNAICFLANYERQLKMYITLYTYLSILRSVYRNLR